MLFADRLYEQNQDGELRDPKRAYVEPTDQIAAYIRLGEWQPASIYAILPGKTWAKNETKFPSAVTWNGVSYKVQTVQPYMINARIEHWELYAAKVTT